MATFSLLIKETPPPPDALSLILITCKLNLMQASTLAKLLGSILTLWGKAGWEGPQHHTNPAPAVNWGQAPGAREGNKTMVLTFRAPVLADPSSGSFALLPAPWLHFMWGHKSQIWWICAHACHTPFTLQHPASLASSELLEGTKLPPPKRPALHSSFLRQPSWRQASLSLL